MLDSCLIKKQWFIQSREGNIDKYYKFDFNPKAALGAGTYGSVFKAINLETNETRAIKAILKSKVKNQERFKLEIDIMRKLDHPNVIKLYETFEDPKYLYLVMELCEGGELFDRIIAKGHFNEVEARSIFRQIMQALTYCHSAKICHRDLKPENFLLLNKKDDLIKVIDFGLSTYISAISAADSKIHMKTKAGTPYYISPEVLSGDYDEGCDIWSSGVILYILLSGVPPFYGNTDPEILDMVKKGIYTFEIPEFKKVSEEAKDLIRKMICKPDKRLRAHEVLEHPWMKIELPGEKQEFNWGTFKQFQSHRKIKRVALTYIASQLQESEIIELGKLFKQIDKNGDGVLTIDEIKIALGESNDQSLLEIQKVLHSIDSDGSGTINYTEFLAATMEKSLYMKKEKVYQAFKTFDIDGSGKISAQELKNILGKDENLKNKTDDYWENMIKEADKNGDGEIDYNEFFEMMESALI